jgi:hypothetical protein
LKSGVGESASGWEWGGPPPPPAAARPRSSVCDSEVWTQTIGKGCIGLRLTGDYSRNRIERKITMNRVGDANVDGRRRVVYGRG